MSYIPPGAGGGDLVLVDQQVIAGAAADVFDFVGLNGDLDGSYELSWWMEAREALAVKVFMLANLSSANTASVWTETIGVPAAPNSLNEKARLVCASGMQRPQAWGHVAFGARTGAVRGFTSTAGEGFGVDAANYSRWRSQGMWRDTTTNITSLRLYTVNAADASIVGWGIGSRCQLWKRPY